MPLNMSRMLFLCRERSGGAFFRIRNQKREERATVRCNARLGGGRSGIPWVIIEEERAAPYFGGKKDCHMRQIRTVSIGEVQAFLQNHPGGFLIDVLPPEFHAQQHIPGSSGVCVFETAFQEKMRALVPDMAAPLLVYGAGGSLDSAVAAEKLQREGYTDNSLFAGGLEAWRKAGLPLEGAGVDFPVQDESPLPMFKEYTLIPEKSFIQWACHNTVHSHDGTLSVRGGELRFPHGPQGEGDGFLTMDMNGIACRDLAQDEMLPVLIAHLKSLDFFDVMAYPTAQLDILSLMPLSGASVTGRTHRLQGQLSVLRTERAIECDAELRNLPDGELSMFCQLVWDRTLWGVRYGSARFYRFLGMHSVDDNISLSVMLFFRSQRP